MFQRKKISKELSSVKSLTKVLCATLLLSSCSSNSLPESNNLSLGSAAKSANSIPLRTNGETILSGKTKEYVLSNRQKYVGQHPELLAGSYKPNEAMFAGIVDGKDWWGLQGQMFCEHELPVAEGLARDSLYLFNPYWLVVPNIVIRPISWSPQRFPTVKDFSRSLFPVTILPEVVLISPAQKHEEISYDAIKLINQANTVVQEPVRINNIGFDLVSYNAKDFGYNYMYIDPNKSANISKYPNGIIQITENFQAREQRSAPSGYCNEAYPVDEALKGFTLKNVPARLEVYLWKEKPMNYLVKPDFTVTANFK